MRFEMFERLRPGLFRSRQKKGSLVKGVPVIVRRPLTTAATYPFMTSGDITSLGQPCADPENRVFRSLDRHTRWATVNELTHARAPH
jgi:hypothetical protein